MTENAEVFLPVDFENNTPNWLNAEFFHDVLEKEFGIFNIVDFSFEDATDIGENLLSTLYLVTIKIQLSDIFQETVSYMVKVLPEGAVFPKEIELLSDIMPKFEYLYRHVGIEIQFTPRCLKFSTEPAAIVMENINSKGFLSANRIIGLDLQHVKCVLEILAKFHAASACYVERCGPFPPQIAQGEHSAAHQNIVETIRTNNKNIMRECLVEKGFNTMYLDKLDNISDAFYDNFLESVEVNPEEFNVLNHGDLWVNNIMFQYNNLGTIERTILTDFHVTKWGSPLQDLMFLIVSSCNEDIRVKQVDFIIKYYHDELIKNLNILSYQKPYPMLSDLHSQFLKRGFFAIEKTLGATAVTLLEKNENVTFDNFMNSSQVASQTERDLYSNPRFANALSDLFPLFDNKGLPK